jgi:hypothetical protein
MTTLFLDFVPFARGFAVPRSVLVSRNAGTFALNVIACDENHVSDIRDYGTSMTRPQLIGI